MRSVINQKLVTRNARIGQYTSLGALAILGVGLYITFKMPDKIVYSLGALLVGFFLSQMGIYYGNRWGRRPRPDELIDRNLKGMGREYIVYHYISPASHLLVGPAGVWVLLPYLQGGTISFQKNRWRASGGSFSQKYLRIFGQENIGRPDLDASSEIDAARRFLARKLPEGGASPEIKAALIFFNPNIELKIEDAPLPALKPAELKDFLKQQAKEKPIGKMTLDNIQNALPQPEND